MVNISVSKQGMINLKLPEKVQIHLVTPRGKNLKDFLKIFHDGVSEQVERSTSFSLN